MKLHYSQTWPNAVDKAVLVLLPYEITLFSNYLILYKHCNAVLLPYEITLFSNKSLEIIKQGRVLLPYEITLFSNKNRDHINFN